MMTRHALRRSLAITVAIFFCTMCLNAQEPPKKVRIIQTNSAGDNIHLIDPATNKVVGVIDGIEVNTASAERRTAVASTSATKRRARSTSSMRRA